MTEFFFDESFQQWRSQPTSSWWSDASVLIVPTPEVAPSVRNHR